MADNVPARQAGGVSVVRQNAFKKVFDALKNEYMSYHPTFVELQRYIDQTRGFFEDSQPNDGKKLDHKVLIDDHATQEKGILAKGMSSGMTNPSRPWFLLSTGKEDLDNIHEVRLWTDEVRDRMLDVYAHSNIYGCLHSAYEELGQFGTACIYIEEDFNFVIRGRFYTIGEYYIGVGADGRVNKFARPFWLTVSQMVEKFGLENCSDAIKAAYDNHQTELRVKVYSLVEPNDNRIPHDPTSKGMMYRSVHWEASDKAGKFLRESGFESFPFLVPRWDTTTSQDAFGKGPGWHALGNVKMLQALHRKQLLGIDKNIDPPVQMDSTVIGEFNSLPGGVTKYSGTTPNSGVRAAYEVRPDVAGVEAKIERVQEAISRNFFSNLFLMFAEDDHRMTAMEVAQRQSEKLQILGPVLERLENELLTPLIERTFQIMLRNGLIPEPPEQLQGVDLKVRYVSILAQAQKAASLTSVQQALGLAGNVATIDPSVMDNYDLDMIVRDTSTEMLAIPQKYLNSVPKRDQIRKQRAQQQQQAAALAAAESATASAKSAAGAAKDLGQTPVGANTALDAMLEGVTGRRA